MIFFVSSILFFSLFNLYILIKKKQVKKFFIINLIISIWILCLIVFTFQNDYSFFKLLYYFSLSIYMVIRVFTFSSNIEEIMKYYYNLNGVSDFIELYICVLFILASIMTFSIILDLFFYYYNDKKIKYYPYKRRHIFFNSSNIHLKVSQDVSNILKGKIFFGSTIKTNYNTINNSVLLKEDMLAIFKKMHRYSKENRFYILEDSLQATLTAISLIEMYGENKTNDKLFVLDKSGIIRMYLEDKILNDKQFKIRIINKEKDTVYNFFYEHFSIFINALKNNIIIIGDDYKSIEVLKIVLWLNQILNTNICVIYIYKDLETEIYIREKMPSVFTKNSYEFNYTIKFIKVESFESEKLNKIISKLYSISTVFWSLGNEIENIKLSYFITEVPYKFALVENMININIIESNTNTKVIDFSNINLHLNSGLEKKGLELHIKHCEGSLEKTFFNSEYNYYSSLARAIAIRFMETYPNLGGLNLDKREIEHNRWSLFLKTEGWKFGDKRVDSEKIHNLLIPFNKLDEFEKNKDL